MRNTSGSRPALPWARHGEHSLTKMPSTIYNIEKAGNTYFSSVHGFGSLSEADEAALNAQGHKGKT